MLDLMRKNAGSWMIKFIVFAIAAVFVFWGVGNFRERRANLAATVNGEPITLQEYRRAYDNYLEQLQQRFGNALDEQMLEQFNVKEAALNQIIEQKLLLSEARQLDIRVTDRELARTIRNYEVFQTAGGFDSRRYRSILSRYSMTPEDFESSQKDAMMAEKLRRLVTDSIKVSEAEAREWYQWGNAETAIDYVRFPPEQYTQIDVSEDEIDAHFADHQEAYRTEPRVKVRYLHFRPQDYAEQVTVAAEELRDYYDTHPQEFDQPKRIEARHILIRVDEAASPQEVAAAKEKAYDILMTARAGEDFADLAREHSQDAAASRGGYLGEFSREQVDPAFAQTAFAMEPGQISEPVRTANGWHVIKVEKVKEAATQSFEAASAAIADKLREDRMRSHAYEAAVEIYEASYDTPDLQKLAALRQLDVQTTDYFLEAEPPAGVAAGAAFAEAAFELAPEEISEIQDYEDGYYLLQLAERLPAEIPALKDVREQVRQDLLAQKQLMQARQDAQGFLDALRQGQSVEALCERFGVELAGTDFFKRGGYVPEIGHVPELSQTAFKLSASDPLASQPLSTDKGIYVIRFRERRAADAQGFAEDKEAIRQQLMQQKQMRTYREWLAGLHKRSDIQISPGILD